MLKSSSLRSSFSKVNFKNRVWMTHFSSASSSAPFGSIHHLSQKNFYFQWFCIFIYLVRVFSLFPFHVNSGNLVFSKNEFTIHTLQEMHTSLLLPITGRMLTHPMRGVPWWRCDWSFSFSKMTTSQFRKTPHRWWLLLHRNSTMDSIVHEILFVLPFSLLASMSIFLFLCIFLFFPFALTLACPYHQPNLTVHPPMECSLRLTALLVSPWIQKEILHLGAIRQLLKLDGATTVPRWDGHSRVELLLCCYGCTW